MFARIEVGYFTCIGYHSRLAKEQAMRIKRLTQGRPGFERGPPVKKN